jgi:topoisomerase IA-like protein
MHNTRRIRRFIDHRNKRSDGKTNSSLGKRFTPDSITLEDAIEMLEKKRTSPKRAWKGKKK